MLAEFYRAGVELAFEKLALDLKGARQAVTATVKPNLIRRGITISKSYESKLGLTNKASESIGPSTIPSKLTNKKLLGTRTGSQQKFYNNFKPNTILAKGGVRAPFNPENKEMFNRTALMHEALEARALREGGDTARQWMSGHADPSVILRENNMISSLGADFQPVKDTYNRLRKRDGTAHFLKENIPGYQYGEKRYSRHAIKRMREILERKGVGSIGEDQIAAKMFPSAAG